MLRNTALKFRGPFYMLQISKMLNILTHFTSGVTTSDVLLTLLFLTRQPESPDTQLVILDDFQKRFIKGIFHI